MKSCVPSFDFPNLRLAHLTAREGRHLPRWEASGATYHIAFHLADSVPANQLRAWQEARALLKDRLDRENRRMTETERNELKALYNERIERYLATGYGECLLAKAEIQTCVREILLHENGTSYALHAWCIMPNHLHVVVGSFSEPADMTKTLSSWKRISGHRINKLLERKGPVWNSDGYTRIIRDKDEYKAQMNYVWHNPESAGLTSGFARERYVNVEGYGGMRARALRAPTPPYVFRPSGETLRTR